MAPLTLTEKYDDLVRCADQPLSSYSKLTDEDLEVVISKLWPFIIESITYTPLSTEKINSIMSTSQLTGEVYIKLERRLKIHFPLYSEAAKRHQQKFPNRKAIRWNRHHTNTGSLSSDTNSTFSFDNTSEMNIPDFYVFCTSKYPHSIKQQQINYDRVRNYLMTTKESSPYRMLVFKQALKECCRCRNYYHLENLCLAIDISIENVYFDNNDTVLHETIKLNNKQLTTELIRRRFKINVDGELGTPLVTAMHYDILWAVELLLNNGADLTKRHIDWPFLTLYEYCIQFAKIDMKLIIDKHITSLIQKCRYTTIRELINNGWNIHLKKRYYIHNNTKIK